MKFFIDTANVDEIREAASLGVLDGVTTNPSLIAKELYENEPIGKYKLLARILLSLETDPKGEIAWFSLSRKEIAQCERDRIDTDGFVDFTRSIRGIRVVLFLRELGENRFKVSMRSKDETNVAALARRFAITLRFKRFT